MSYVDSTRFLLGVVSGEGTCCTICLLSSVHARRLCVWHIPLHECNCPAFGEGAWSSARAMLMGENCFASAVTAPTPTQPRIKLCSNPPTSPSNSQPLLRRHVMIDSPLAAMARAMVAAAVGMTGTGSRAEAGLGRPELPCQGEDQRGEKGGACGVTFFHDCLWDGSCTDLFPNSTHEHDVLFSLDEE